MLIFLNDLYFLIFWNIFFVIFNFVLFYILRIKEIKNFIGRSSLSICCSYFKYQVHEKVLHIFFVSDNEINISMIKLKSQALPTIKWNILKFIFWHWVKVFSQHPKPCIRSPEMYSFYLGYIATARRLLVSKIWIDVHFFICVYWS